MIFPSISISSIGRSASVNARTVYGVSAFGNGGGNNLYGGSVLNKVSSHKSDDHALTWSVS